MTSLAKLLFPLLILANCGETKEPYSFADPDKSDGLGSQVVTLGELPMDGEVSGRFESDGQFDGYHFEAKAGAVITLDNSHRGSASRLDSVMAIYGPRNSNGDFGSVIRAEDDDSGWGRHARIKNFTVPETGEYLVVMGTYLGLDRGQYRLTLACQSESCTPESGPVLVSASEIQTSEDGTTQSFQIRLREKPTQQVQIWIDSDNADEAIAVPSRVFFCPEGTALDNVGCTTDLEDLVGNEGDWQRTVTIRVTGVRDAVADGDQAFSVKLRVESQDGVYGTVELAPLSGRNIDVANASAPTYSDLDGLRDDALLQALQQRIGGHQVFGYHGVNSARTLLFSSVGSNAGVIESIYTGSQVETPGDSISAFMAGYNTEHSWPQSQFKKLDPMVSDLHHIYVADTSSNGSRSNYGFGYNTDPDIGISLLGRSTTDGRGKVYQVRPERRGDIARAHFYMVARYGFDTTLGIEFDDDKRAENGRMKDLEEVILREWNRQDPVDDRERKRNERIEAVQGNRNPFIDRPDLVERISDF